MSAWKDRLLLTVPERRGHAMPAGPHGETPGRLEAEGGRGSTDQRPH